MYVISLPAWCHTTILVDSIRENRDFIQGCTLICQHRYKWGRVYVKKCFACICRATCNKLWAIVQIFKKQCKHSFSTTQIFIKYLCKYKWSAISPKSGRYAFKVLNCSQGMCWNWKLAQIAFQHGMYWWANLQRLSQFMWKNYEIAHFFLCDDREENSRTKINKNHQRRSKVVFLLVPKIACRVVRQRLLTCGPIARPDR